MKTSTQLKALIRNLAKDKSIQAEIILRNFMLERFPYLNTFPLSALLYFIFLKSIVSKG